MKMLRALIFFLMASCASLPSTRNSLVGEWRYADKVQSCHYVFKNDGLFTGDVIYQGKLLFKFTGRWSVEGKALLYTYINDAMGRIPPGATDRDQLLSVKKDLFVIEAKDGSRRQYSRMK
ncbi:MAG: hypothetical protein DLM73_03660 [Chthoniobacterales bacterium]|nr:MAG: hypothetical protein DLM73_03660 [Chthoniobacterales bacterium]